MNSGNADVTGPAQRPLRAVMRARHVSYSEVSRIGVQVSEALVRGHTSGAPHGAISPEVILLSEDGRARLIAPPNRRAPDAYLAPEQVRGEPVGPQTDVYALGLVLLEAATGRQVYPGEGPDAARARLYHQPEVPNDVPTGLARALLAMTETAPESRPSAERAVDLLSSRSQSPAPAGAETAPATAGALGGMSAGRMAAIGLPVLALLVIIGILLFANSSDDDTAGKKAAGSSSSASATNSSGASDETGSARPTGSASKPGHSKIALPTELPDMPKFTAPKMPTSEDVSSSVTDKVQKAWDDFTDWLGSFVK